MHYSSIGNNYADKTQEDNTDKSINDFRLRFGDGMACIDLNRHIAPFLIAK